MSNHHAGSFRRLICTLAVAGLGSAVCASALAAPAAARAPQERISYTRVGAQPAQAYNLADAQAVSVLELAPQTVLSVHATRNGWLDVEAPGGFQVWVWGEYLNETGEAGMLEVTGNDVRMRPLPSSGIESYALEQRLSRGQRVRMIQRSDASKPMARDWVQVWSPPGARAWVRQADTAALASGESGASLWAAAVTATLDQRKTAPKAVSASAPNQGGASAAAPAEVKAAMQAAEARFANERSADEAGGTPDYAGVLAAYEAVAAMGVSGATAEKLASRRAEVSARLSAYEIRQELEAERARRLKEAEEANERINNAGNRDPYFGRFDARGWLVPVYTKDQERPSYMLRWGGQDVAEVVCFSGRYDVSVFSGYQLGVNGARLRGPIEASAGRPGRVPQIDIQRLEVLASRAGKR